MADPNQLSSDLLAVLAKHGVAGLSATETAAPASRLSAAASYIREIITGDQKFDEQVLSRVANVLATR